MVLIVDGYELLFNDIKLIFDVTGYEAYWINNPIKATGYIKKFSTEISHIIFDLFVENEITAVGMLAEVHDIVKEQNIELIAKLHKRDINYQKKLANFGVKNFLIKPFTWDRLVEVASHANVI
ncbi:MAG: hypothetical protein HRU35_06810 [Rickettsiaceae bacterium]|nr:hypothetical protein [Rickettsiaceae bacterium]